MGNKVLTLTTEKAHNFGSDVQKIDRIIMYIRKREEIPKSYYSIKKILNGYDMELYANMCCDRIADENKIDGEHVMIDFFEIGDILVDWIGFIECEEIISGYIAVKECEKIGKLLASEQKLVESDNRIIRSLKSFSSKDIKNALKGKKTKEIDDDMWNKMIVLFKEEIEARRMKNVLKKKVQKKVKILYNMIKYHEVISFLHSFYRGYDMEV